VVPSPPAVVVGEAAVDDAGATKRKKCMRLKPAKKTSTAKWKKCRARRGAQSESHPLPVHPNKSTKENHFNSWRTRRTPAH
jgi:hypothetical protein